MEEDIHSNFEDLHKQLDVRRSVLLMELEVTYGLKQKVGGDPHRSGAAHNRSAAGASRRSSRPRWSTWSRQKGTWCPPAAGVRR